MGGAPHRRSGRGFQALGLPGLLALLAGALAVAASGDRAPSDVAGPGETGSCCFGNGDCVTDTFAACDVVGGVWEAGLDCTVMDCPFNEAACCLHDATCIRVIEASCLAAGGTWFGSTNCPGVICPQPSGACCLSGGGCLNVTQLQCGQIGGTWTQPFLDCEIAPCS